MNKTKHLLRIHGRRHLAHQAVNSSTSCLVCLVKS